MLAGYIALCVLLIILAAIISLRLSAQEARAASELPAPVYSSAALAAHLAVAPDVAAHEPQIPEPPAEPEPEPRYEEITAEERELLARVVYAEANTETLEGQIAVAQVVLNRVRSESFPDTVSEVVFQDGQFSTASILGSVVPNETNYEAVDAAFETEVVPYEVLYFSRGAENDRVWGQIGAHDCDTNCGGGAVEGIHSRQNHRGPRVQAQVFVRAHGAEERGTHSAESGTPARGHEERGLYAHMPRHDRQRGPGRLPSGVGVIRRGEDRA